MKKHLIMFILLLSGLLLCQSLYADTAKGRLEFISNKAQTIQFTDGKTKQKMVIRVNDDTKFVNINKFKDLKDNDLVLVQFEPGQAASSVELVLAEVDPKQLITTREMIEVVQGRQGKYTLVDARPASRYNNGHIPTAINIDPDEFDEKLNMLPQDKGQMVIYYCGGITCPLSPKSGKLAAKQGYTNIRIYNEGMPAWKKAGQFVMVNNDWLAKNLDEQHVILDLRPASEASKSRIKTAVSISLSELQSMGAEFKKNKVKSSQKYLPNLKDKDAHITVYASDTYSPEAVHAFVELRRWSYKNVTILNGGFNAWKAANLPTESGAVKTPITYVKKASPGAIYPEQFKGFVEADKGIVLDVRTTDEASSGVVKGAVHIPLDDLEARVAELPKDKPIVTYCATGARASMAYQLLNNLGYAQAQFLDEAIEVDGQGNYKFP